MSWRKLASYYDTMYQCRKEPCIPDNEVLLATSLIPGRGKVLDIGCGLGRNALYLAKLGFRVTAIDLSAVAIEILNERAAERHLKIEAIQGNIIDVPLGDDYDLIVATRTLQHFDRHTAHQIITGMQEKTALGGMNVVIAYAKGNLTSDDPLPEHYYFKPHEIWTRYDGWAFPGYKENGEIHLVARKR